MNRQQIILLQSHIERYLQDIKHLQREIGWREREIGLAREQIEKYQHEIGNPKQNTEQVQP